MSKKRIVSFTLSPEVDDALTKVSNAMGWSKSEIAEKALSKVLENPSFCKAIEKIVEIQKEIEKTQP